MSLAWPCSAGEPAFRYAAPISVIRPAPFVQLALPASAYQRSQGDALQDLRIVDARGERVPFALLGARAGESQDVVQGRATTLYPLPRRPAAGQPWTPPVEVLVEGERISIKRLGGGQVADAGAGTGAVSAGWLIDLGERRSGDPPPRSLRMAWSGPAEFSVSYELETSEDLRTWRAGGSGQLMALASAAGPLTQPGVMLSAAAGRFVRLVWQDSATAPAITGATLETVLQRDVLRDAPAEWSVRHSPEPAGKTASDPMARRALHFDLGGALPLAEVDLQWASGTRVAPVRIQARKRLDEPWRDMVQGVFYRVERGNAVSQSPPLALNTPSRYLRIVPDERAPALDGGDARLVVRAHLASLVFAAQGQAPFSLLAGAADAQPGALPVATLVPALEDERPGFGRATLGDWVEVPEIARQAEAEQRMARMRPWLLWAVLLGGIAALGWMVWRLARGARKVGGVN
ncbi:MAG: DUF3999 family protein [Burkholderiales bacterium]|nr:DUF3999 family protein [Burkholderiales bacterium]